MKRRAEAEARTRLQITESTVALHGTVGPSRTTVSAVARKAGVRRSTVYRHFPDEESLFAACTSHWMAQNPAPDVSRWATIADPAARLKPALTETYVHYRRTRQMMDNILRDEEAMPIVKQLLSTYRDYLESARGTLLVGWPAAPRIAAAIGHALAFATWKSLAREQTLDDDEAAELMCLLVTGAARA